MALEVCLALAAQRLGQQLLRVFCFKTVCRRFHPSMAFTCHSSLVLKCNLEKLQTFYDCFSLMCLHKGISFFLPCSFLNNTSKFLELLIAHYGETFQMEAELSPTKPGSQVTHRNIILEQTRTRAPTASTTVHVSCSESCSESYINNTTDVCARSIRHCQEY
jgi:hypothetical protein